MMTRKVFEDDAPHLLLQTTRQKTKLIPNAVINQITADIIMLNISNAQIFKIFSQEVFLELC